MGKIEVRYVEVLGYIYILQLAPRYGNAFKKPHGGLFQYFSVKVLAFCFG
jgi:hypothetical protein